jgi:predicted P-loop ATPase
MGAIGAERERSPFMDRVRSERWDGTKRIGSWLHRLWGTPDDEFHSEAGAKFLVGSIGRQLSPGCKMDWMLVVIGPQGTGKSSMPAVLFDGLDTALIGKPDSKDLIMLIHSGLCSVWDELDTFRKMDMDHLKAVVSNPSDRLRPPYGRTVVNKARRSVMYGCGNNNDFLQSDPTGYRRYAIVTIDRMIDFRVLESERWQMWAEALWEYEQGGVDFSQVSGATERAQAHVIDDPFADKVMEFLLAHEVAHPGGAIGMSHVLFALNRERDANNIQVKRTIADTLIAMGYEKGVFKRYDGANFQKNSWRKKSKD